VADEMSGKTSDKGKGKTSGEKMCPILAQKWLANKFAARTKGLNTFKLENLPKCFKEDCAAWNPEKGLGNPGYCKMVNRSLMR